MIHFRLPKFDDLKHPPPLFRNPPPDITPIQLKVWLRSFIAQFVARYGIQFWHALIDMHASPCVLPYADKALGEFFCYLRLEKLHENVIDLHALAYGLDCMDDDAPPPLMMLHPNDQDEDDDIQPVPDPLPPYIYIYIYIFPVRIAFKEVGVDYLAHVHEPLYSGIMSPPQRLSVMIKNHQPTLGILVMLPLGPDSPHSSRYGMSSLMKIAAPTTSEFEFLKLTHSRNELFFGVY
ncbi:hypothetical protein Bca52824_053225 [Brassica carinata]|uniref:Uncharacterized protein n=1 Tax=Brassica carinata TaxID=52824 RepID=A0A8X7R4U6_BRACI|nr:hypothetical protein Bca52824_053225 [Brassica carinata]